MARYQDDPVVCRLGVFCDLNVVFQNRAKRRTCRKYCFYWQIHDTVTEARIALVLYAALVIVQSDEI